VAGKHVPLAGATALVLGATGPVGQRAVRLLAGQGAKVRVGSRAVQRARTVCEALGARMPAADLSPHGTLTPGEIAAALEGVQILIAAGAVGVRLLSAEARQTCPTLNVAIDLNAVPPAGLEGIDVMDRGTKRDGIVSYGAVGVGGTKMKIHKAALQKLFERNDHVLDAEEIYAIGSELVT
jgi:NAD(P)-dependent dehydrogenase (short-subunit alcohol dehydrogenase family)